MIIQIISPNELLAIQVSVESLAHWPAVLAGQSIQQIFVDTPFLLVLGIRHHRLFSLSYNLGLVKVICFFVCHNYLGRLSYHTITRSLESTTYAGRSSSKGYLYPGRQQVYLQTDIISPKIVRTDGEESAKPR